MKMIIKEDDFARAEQLTKWIRSLTSQTATEFFDFNENDEKGRFAICYGYSSYKTINEILCSMLNELEGLFDKMAKTPTIRG